jgi:hypothetical protein
MAYAVPVAEYIRHNGSQHEAGEPSAGNLFHNWKKLRCDNQQSKSVTNQEKAHKQSISRTIYEHLKSNKILPN